MNEVYAITNLDGYICQMRGAAADFLSENHNNNLDDFISLNQVANLVKTECLGFDDKDNPMLNEEINEKIFKSIMVWIHNVGLAKLAGQNLLECAWDSDLNEMVFWAKETKVENYDKPKTKRNSSKNKKS